MVKYLRSHELFETLREQHYPIPARPPGRIRAGVHFPFRRWDSTMKFESVAFQERFLHANARVTHVEVMDLVCAKMNWTQSRSPT